MARESADSFHSQFSSLSIDTTTLNKKNSMNIKSNDEILDLKRQIFELNIKLKELEKERSALNSPLNSQLQKSSFIGDENLEIQIADLIVANVKLLEEKNAIKSQLDAALSEKSELESMIGSPLTTRAYGDMSTPLTHTHSINRYNIDSPIPMRSSLSRQFCEVIYIGIIKRKQNSFPGFWLPRLLIIDQQFIEFWSFPPGFEAVLKSIHANLKNSNSDERKKILTSNNCLFRVRILFSSYSTDDNSINF